MTTPVGVAQLRKGTTDGHGCTRTIMLLSIRVDPCLSVHSTQIGMDRRRVSLGIPVSSRISSFAALPSLISSNGT
jgi:hypothetical protein